MDDENVPDDFYSVDAVKSYLMELRKIPLFSYEEEVQYFKSIADAEDKLKSINDKKEIEKLNKKIIRCRNAIVEANLRLVVSIAKNYVNRGLEFLDLIQEGNNGLMTEITKYNYKRGYKFSTYATVDYQLVTSLRLGIYDEKLYSISEIGEIFNISDEEVLRKVAKGIELFHILVNGYQKLFGKEFPSLDGEKGLYLSLEL